MHRNKSVSAHQFSMVPRADIPRSGFRMEKALKTAFNASELVPIFCEEVLPGDTWRLKATMFARLATPIYPVMDNLHLDTFFFFVPNRLVWENWERLMGAQDEPNSSINYTVPQITSPSGGYEVGSLFDYFGLPTAGQVGEGETVTHNVLPLRMYNLIMQEWFRDQNLIGKSAYELFTDDGPDDPATYNLAWRMKRHDYFTSCLPWPLKGGVSVPLPLSGDAPVIANTFSATSSTPHFTPVGDSAFRIMQGSAGVTDVTYTVAPTATGNLQWTPGLQIAGPDIGQPHTGLVADLTDVAAATINELRQAFQIQRLLERDARGGTRYTEVLQAHFGVRSPDARLQRPEYLGGGSTHMSINPIAQTSATDVTGSTTPQGNLSAFGTALARGHGFSQSFVEHGYVIGLVNVRADITYQQGLRRHWSRQTRYDFYFPVFAHLGEQAVLSKEIYCTGGAGDEDVFGYQERWAEYRYTPSEITGVFRSTAALGVDAWHFAEDFATRPTLNDIFIQDKTQNILARNLAVGAAAGGQQIIMDAVFEINAARPMPMYSVPGLIDHF